MGSLALILTLKASRHEKGFLLSHSEILLNEKKVIERLFLPLWLTKLCIRTEQELPKKKSESLCLDKNYIGH